MRLEALRIRHLGPFQDFSIDFADYADQLLIAIVGKNGAGKSTMLELALPGAMYRSTPTRGSLVDLATARDAMLEARVVNGSTWTLRHLVDAVSKKSEAIVLDAAGAAVLPDAKVRSFDAWAAKHLPSPEVLLASVFAPQGAAGFLGMKPGDRKAVLLRVLGVERLELLAEQARERHRAALAQVEDLQAKIGEEIARTGDADALADQLESARAEAHEADEALAAARAELAAGQAEAQARATRAAAAKIVLERRAEIEAALGTARATADGLYVRIRNNRAALAQADEIRAAVRRLEVLPADIAAAEARAAQASQARAVAQADMRAAEAAKAAAGRDKVAAGGRADRARARLAEADAVSAAADQIQPLREAVLDVGAEAQLRSNDLDALRGKRLAGAAERITALRAGLEGISELPDDGDIRHASVLADSTLAVDDEAVTLAAELPAQLKAAEAALRAAQDRLAVAQRKLADTELVAARLGDVEAARGELDDAAQAEQAADERWSAAHAELGAATARADRASREVKEADPSALRAERDSLAPLAAKEKPLAQAETRLAELEPQLTAGQAELARLEAQLSATPAPNPEPSPAPAIADLEGLVRAAEQAGKDAVKLVTLLEARLETARAGGALRAELEGKRAAADGEVADWARLSSDLGRDGLQAAEIDSAGPELTELVNDLLHTCMGPRFTVSIETTRLSADGKRQIEGCEVRVLDTVKSRDAEAATYSGGERVLLGEAMSLALSMLACRRAGLEGVTLVRDETGAALDPENARAYVAMLRRSAELVKAEHVLFVSHSPEVQDLADARIDLGGAAL